MTADRYTRAELRRALWWVADRFPGDFIVMAEGSQSYESWEAAGTVARRIAERLSESIDQ